MRFRFIGAPVLAGALLLPGSGASAALSAPAADRGMGRVTVTVRAPEGVPAGVELNGKVTRLAPKAPAGPSAVVDLTLPAGAYHVSLPAVTFGGRRYVGTSSRPEVVVKAGTTATLDASFLPDPGAFDLHTTSISRTSISLKWNAAPGSRFSIRRTKGRVVAAHRGQGVDVAVDGMSATDQGLEPGTTYTYAVFTQNHSRWYGPLAVVASTAAPQGSTQATFVASPSTLLATSGEVASAVPNGSGVTLLLAPGVAAPLLGAAVVLPISSDLPGGFLGVVAGISQDGRTVSLEAGGLADAFDYYDLDVQDLTAGYPGDADAGSTGIAGPLAAPQANSSVNGAVAPAVLSSVKTAQAAPAAAASGEACSTSLQKPKVTFEPGIQLGGHFKTRLDAHKSAGASVDLALTAKVTGAAAITTGASVTCTIKLKRVAKTISYSPVPMAVSFEPSVRFTLSGSLQVSNIGYTATGGVAVSGTMTFTKGASFSGHPKLDAAPLKPKLTANGSVGLRLGGELVLGPGVTTDKAGVIAGLHGDFSPLDAAFSPYFTAQDSRFNLCSVTSAKFTRKLGLTVQAWLGKKTSTKTVALGALDGSTPYPGSPWHLPEGCKNLPADDSKDSLLGPGVGKVSDATVGNADQWGHVEGFAPGKKTWVLSSGRIADAIAAPATTASTDLNTPGDPLLSALAGYPTQDAASYTVTVKPTGSKLHVRYVFATEEFPEYVNSSYNDVMAVFVDGKNCATVPGTADAVSVNTVNTSKNSAYFVDNRQGAAGYGTSMNGLTVPLTCTVPVTPGKAVTVKIAVADTSDGILDSAVALLDGGIWTD